tara:strand:- start:104 stop:730 length:627 start_codon:yes stop_codon:yes gene_type:complete
VLILASASISRKNLLKNSDINFIQLSSSFDESSVKEKDIKDLALKLSFSKAEIIKNKIKEINLNENFKLKSIEILGCDSVFEFNGKALGKPKDKEDAYQRWIEMSENFGFLHTGHTLLFCELINNSKRIILKKEVKKTITSKIIFSKLQNREISRYVDSLEPLNCAGGFALEGKGGKFIEKIDGCFSNIMGLSLPWLRKELLIEGIIA